MANLGSILVKKIFDKQIDPKTLTTRDRRLCVRTLANSEKYAQSEMAEILGVGDSDISKDMRKIEEDNAWMFELMVDESKLIVRTILSAKNKSARLCRLGKHKDAWTVEKECIELLQSLGYIKKTATEVTLKGSLTVQEILKLAPDQTEDETYIFNANNGRGPEESNRITP